MKNVSRPEDIEFTPQAKNIAVKQNIPTPSMAMSLDAMRGAGAPEPAAGGVAVPGAAEAPMLENTAKEKRKKALQAALSGYSKNQGSITPATSNVTPDTGTPGPKAVDYGSLV